MSSFRKPSPSVRGLLLLVIGICLMLDVAFAVASSPGHKTWERVGLQYPYTYGTCSSTSVVDPVNVVWYGGGPTPGNVGATLKKHGWGENDYQDPTLQVAHELGISGVDSQYIHTINSEGTGCFRDYTHRANGNPFGDRYHVRLFGTANRNNTLYVVAMPTMITSSLVMAARPSSVMPGTSRTASIQPATQSRASGPPRRTGIGATASGSGSATVVTHGAMDTFSTPRQSSQAPPAITPLIQRSRISRERLPWVPRSPLTPASGPATRQCSCTSGAMSTQKPTLQPDFGSDI